MLSLSAVSALLLLLSAGASSSFVLQSKPVDYGQCNKTVSSTGKFSSPGYPTKYPTSFSCLYFFEAPPGSRAQVTLHFVDTEPCCDYIEVYDGPSQKYPRINKRVSGHLGSIQQVFLATGTSLTVLFYSDLTVAYNGFEAYYTSI